MELLFKKELKKLLFKKELKNYLTWELHDVVLPNEIRAQKHSKFLYKMKNSSALQLKFQTISLNKYK